MENVKFVYLYPEIWLVSLSLLTLLIGSYTLKYSKWITYFLTQLALSGTLFLIINLLGKDPTSLFNNMFVIDNIGILLKALVCLFGIVVILYSQQYIFDHHYPGEYFVLCLFSILGMMILISAGNFLSLYLGIELLTLPLYALITMTREDALSSEAAMKYFVLGVVASGLLLYGVSLLYGCTGSFEMKKVAMEVSLQVKAPSMALIFSLVFIIAALAFKFGIAPFHMWLPDVYQGAPLSVTLFIGTLPKLAAFGFAMRLLIDTFPMLNWYWQWLFIFMAILSLSLGNMVALAQTNLKRLLAYSAIAQIGFLWLGLLAGSDAGFTAALDYLIIYALMVLGVFGVMTLLSHQGFEVQEIQDFRGFKSRYPGVALLMAFFLLSLAGLPPFAGFYAKLFVLEALIQAGYVKLALLAVLLSVVGAYYYLRIIRVMYFEEASESVSFGSVSSLEMALLSFNGLAVLMLGIFPAPLLELCSMVFSSYSLF